MPNFIKIHPVLAELFHAERRTDIYEVAFRNFANVPNNQTLPNQHITQEYQTNHHTR